MGCQLDDVSVERGRFLPEQTHASQLVNLPTASCLLRPVHCSDSELCEGSCVLEGLQRHLLLSGFRCPAFWLRASASGGCGGHRRARPHSTQGNSIRGTTAETSARAPPASSTQAPGLSSGNPALVATRLCHAVPAVSRLLGGAKLGQWRGEEK